MALTFHWRMPQGGGSQGRVGADRVPAEAALPEPESQAEFCRQAERCGIESLLIDINYGKPDPMVLGLVLARAAGVSRVRMMVAHRPGLMSPTLFVQQVNTFSALTNGRISLNVVAGHSPDEQRFYGDHQDHDGRYARMDEYLTICRAIWNGPGPVDFRGRFYVIEQGRLNTPFVSGTAARQPDIFLGGNSPQARELAARHATCWVRFGDAPDRLREQIAPVLGAGTAVGVRLSLIIRGTNDEARAAAAALVAGADVTSRSTDERQFVRRSDATSMQDVYRLARDEWPAPALWTGAVPVLGAAALALVGDAPTVAAGLQEFAHAGIEHFILSGWPTLPEMVRFGEEVLPLVRERQHRAAPGRERITDRAPAP
jgi:alkanesulfonate monooxygenase